MSGSNVRTLVRLFMYVHTEEESHQEDKEPVVAALFCLVQTRNRPARCYSAYTCVMPCSLSESDKRV